MAVKIRLARRGRKKRPYYHIVVADARSPRDGKFIENIGSYNPMTSPATIELDIDKALEWMMKGAQPTDTARAILRFRGVLYKKHLMRGVSKEAFSEEKAEEMFKVWIDAKDEKIAARVEQASQEKRDRWNAISGKPGAMPEVASADADAAQAFTAEPATEEVAAEPTIEKETEAPVKEAPVTEEVAAEPVAVKKEEEAKTETPVVDEAKEEVTEVVAEKKEVEVKAEETVVKEEKEELAEIPAGDAPLGEEVKDKAEAAAKKDK